MTDAVQPLLDFSLLDYAAVPWFLLCWAGYAYFADDSRFGKNSMTHLMQQRRLHWMEEMVKRPNRIVDTQIMTNLTNGATFFASTTLLLIGGLFALLGATEKAISIFAAVPFVEKPTLLAWELKVLLLLVIFIYAFFKFAWSFRIFNYCSVLVGAVPNDWENDPSAFETARCAAEVSNLGARHFNNGLRAYFFGQAALAWFLHPALFIIASTWVVYVLYRREYRSRSRKLMMKYLKKDAEKS